MTVVLIIVGAVVAVCVAFLFAQGMEEVDREHRRMVLGLCPYCGEPRHYGRECVPSKRLPPVPEGVRFVCEDGTEIPLELVYDGQDAEGVYMWKATGRVRQNGTVRIDVLPARTSVTLDVAPT